MIIISDAVVMCVKFYNNGISLRKEINKFEKEIQSKYTYIENPEKKDSEDYIFHFDNDTINALDDGDYIIVLCDDDDNGKVILYIPAVIKGSKVTCDFDKIVIN